jgi:hypothetical protein
LNQPTKAGKVTGVDIESTGEQHVRVDVSMGPGNNLNGIVFSQPIRSAWFVPEVGDIVEVYELHTGQRAARLPQTATNYAIPDGLSEGDVAFKVNANTRVHIKQSGDIEIEAGGDLHARADGDIYIGDESNSKRVATEDHTHDYSWTNGGGSGTTDPPDDITESEVE